MKKISVSLFMIAMLTLVGCSKNSDVKEEKTTTKESSVVPSTSKDNSKSSKEESKDESSSEEVTEPTKDNGNRDIDPKTDVAAARRELYQAGVNSADITDSQLEDYIKEAKKEKKSIVDYIKENKK